MGRWQGTKLVRGVKVTEAPEESAEWVSPSGNAWRWFFWGGRLRREHALIAEGVKGIRDAVLYSVAYDQCDADIRASVRLASLRVKEKRDEPATILPFENKEEDQS